MDSETAAMDDECISSSEVTSVTSSDVLQDSESQNCEISKCYSEKRDKRNEESTAKDAIDSENRVPAICIETSDDEEAFERLSINIEEMENRFQFVTDAGPAVNREKESAYCIFSL